MKSAKIQLFKILTDDNFQKEVLENIKPVIVEIGANWCGSCHIIAPIIEKIAEKYKNNIVFGKMDIDSNKQIPQKYCVNEIPLLLFFKNGQIVDSISGAISMKNLETMIKNEQIK